MDREYSISDEELLLNIIKYKIESSNTTTFTLDELYEICEKFNLEINEVNTLLQLDFKRLKYGISKKVGSKIYKEIKLNYLSSIEEEILKYITNKKSETDFSGKFSYLEIEEYSKYFKINKKDFLNIILGIKELRKGPKTANDKNHFHSVKYKKYREEVLKERGNDILESFIETRMKKTGTFKFTYHEIKELSKIYKITPRDFVVHVLGRSEQMYYDFESGRQENCYSTKYKSRKEELVISKKDEFMKEINPNVKTYYSIEELNNLASQLEISTYDLVTIIMNKSRTAYKQVLDNEEVRPRCI